MPLFKGFRKKDKPAELVGATRNTDQEEGDALSNGGDSSHHSHGNKKATRKSVLSSGAGGKPPLKHSSTRSEGGGGFLRRSGNKKTKELTGSTASGSAAAAVASSNSSVVSSGGSSTGSKGRARLNGFKKNNKKVEQKTNATTANTSTRQHPQPDAAIILSADSSVSSVASSVGGGGGGRQKLNSTPPTELTTVNGGDAASGRDHPGVVDASSWDGGADDSSHHSSVAGSGCDGTTNNGTSAASSAASVGSAGGHSSVSGGGGGNQRTGSKSSNSFKKESLRRSCSTGSNPKIMIHSTSAIGLDEMIEDRRVGGDLGQNVVHIEVPFGKPIEEVYDGVHNGPVLGSGIAGMVRLVTHKATGVKYAVKVLDLGLVETPTGLQQLREEIFIMCQLDHPNIVRLEEVYESHTEIYLVQELCLGGELFDRLDEQPDYHYTEAECARLVKQMLSAVRYLHSKGIIHRDLKLENFLFSSVHEDAELKMIDFGLSKHFRYGEVHHEAVGTPYTVAPEVIRGTYDERCDIWAIGVISFLLLSGEPPFGGCGGPEPLMTVRSNILHGRYAFEPADIWELVSPQALSFIRSLLVTDPQQRPTAQEAQQHEWFQEWEPRQNGNNALSANVVKALVNFKEFSDMRKLLCEVLSFTLLPDQIRDLRREFEMLDTDGSGEISLAALKQVLMQNAGAGSLGALTEEEVTDIFDAMRVRKTETRIHWHEFIAAGLSQCSVDDRNLRLAFERLDSDHKGYITLDDIMDLMGSDALQSEEAMRQMWGDSIKAVKCQHARITYDDFLLLMKGQTREHPPDHLHQQRKMQQQREQLEAATGTLVPLGAPVTNLQAVPESRTLDNGPVSSEDSALKPTASQETSNDLSAHFGLPERPLGSGESASAPSTPADHKKIIDVETDDFADSPLSMDEGMPVSASLTPPMTPERGPTDYLSPRAEQQRFMLPPPTTPQNPLFIPSFPVARPYGRGRSRSLGEHGDSGNNDDSERSRDPPAYVEFPDEATAGDLHAMADAVRDMILPEADHGHVPSDLDEVVKDKTKSALVVNRHLYRAHRQMRLAVLEASKRFEEQQTQHARDLILAQREQSEQNEPSAVVHAGLVMRHGHSKQVSSEAIRAMLDRDRAEQQAKVDKASRRGGRGRPSRKKTNSDMAGFLSSTDDLASSSIPSAPLPPLGRNSLGSNKEQSGSFSCESSALTGDSIDNIETTLVGPVGSDASSSIPPISAPATAAVTAAMAGPESRIGEGDYVVGAAIAPTPGTATAKEGPTRGATVPGDFKKTSDPFGRKGKYGATITHWQK